MLRTDCLILNIILLTVTTSDGFQINVLHKPKVHKSFGEGSYVFNQPVYEHGYEGMKDSGGCCVFGCLDGLESQGHGFYQQWEAPTGLDSLYDDPYLDQFLDFLRREYESQNERQFGVGDNISSVVVGHYSFYFLQHFSTEISRIQSDQ